MFEICLYLIFFTGIRQVDATCFQLYKAVIFLNPAHSIQHFTKKNVDAIAFYQIIYKNSHRISRWSNLRLSLSLRKSNLKLVFNCKYLSKNIIYIKWQRMDCTTSHPYISIFLFVKSYLTKQDSNIYLHLLEQINKLMTQDKNHLYHLTKEFSKQQKIMNSATGCPKVEIQSGPWPMLTDSVAFGNVIVIECDNITRRT